jgi:Holliday junction resolvase-like predicted endonuclease
LNLIGRKLTKLELKELLESALKEKNSGKKGKKFEYFFENFMAQQDGFVYVNKHCRSKVGEIDYLYRSEHLDHPLWKNYHYIFIECKNWGDKIGSRELNHFINLIQAKAFLNCFGVYLATGSLSQQAQTTIRDARIKDKLLIIPIERRDLYSLIEKGFKDHIQEACDKILSKA